MSMDANPYQSPSAEPGDPAPEPEVRGRRIRIRLIPATFCGVLGLIFVLGGVLVVGALIWLGAKTGRIDGVAFGPNRDGGNRAAENIATAIVLLAVGGGWLYAAREWLRGHWWRAVLLTLGMYSLAVVGQVLFSKGH